MQLYIRIPVDNGHYKQSISAHKLDILNIHIL